MAKKQYLDLAGLETYNDEIQAQLAGKADSSHNHAASNITSGTLSSDRLPTVPITKGGTGATTAAAALTNLGLTATAAELNKMDGVTATTTELNYVDGVTSNIQTQLNAKAASSTLSSHTGNKSNPHGVTAAQVGTYTTAEIDSALAGKSDTGHTHNYAGSSSAGGAATSANKLNTNAGSATQPVYFADGVPKATTYTLGKSVPSNAVFTDTNTHYTSKNVVGSNTATSNTATALSNGAVYLNSVENGTVTSSHKISGSGATTVTTDTSGNIIISSTDTNTDTNTTYSAGTGISLSGTTFSNSGVRSITTGSSNGTISVNTNGTSANVAVKGLGSAAYTDSSAYAAASHSHSYLPLSGGTVNGALDIKGALDAYSISVQDGTTITSDSVRTDKYLLRQYNTPDTVNYCIQRGTNEEIIFGWDGCDTQFRGKAAHPTYNGTNIALSSDFGKELYSGTWSSGSLTVSGLSNYKLFLVEFSGKDTAILAMIKGTAFRGMGGYPTTSSMTTYHISATVSGDTLTWGTANQVTHTFSGSHGAKSDCTVTRIVGLV